MNWVEYVRRDTEGSDSDTRRRAASELVKSLTDRFPQQVRRRRVGSRCPALPSAARLENEPAQACLPRLAAGGGLVALLAAPDELAALIRSAPTPPPPPQGHRAVQRVRGRHAGRVRRLARRQLEGQGLRPVPGHSAHGAGKDGGGGGNHHQHARQPAGMGAKGRAGYAGGDCKRAVGVRPTVGTVSTGVLGCQQLAAQCVGLSPRASWVPRSRCPRRRTFSRSKWPRNSRRRMSTSGPS